MALSLTTSDFVSGSLLTMSYARPGKLFTAHSAIIVRSVAILTPTTLDRILSTLISVLRPNSP